MICNNRGLHPRLLILRHFVAVCLPTTPWYDCAQSNIQSILFQIPYMIYQMQVELHTAKLNNECNIPALNHSVPDMGLMTFNTTRQTYLGKACMGTQSIIAIFNIFPVLITPCQAIFPEQIEIFSLLMTEYQSLSCIFMHKYTSGNVYVRAAGVNRFGKFSQQF